MNEILTKLATLSIDDLQKLNKALIQTVRAKQKMAAIVNTASFSEGDMVRIKNIRPAHLNGKIGQYKGRAARGNRLRVLINGDYSEKLIPASCLEKV